MDLIKIISSFIIITVSALLSYFFWINDVVAISVLISAIGVTSLVIFLHPKATAIRFLYPGLLTFLLFMLIPMLFTIYVSFTNLSTGHFLSESKVLKYLQEETYLPTNAAIYNFNLNINNQGGYLISFADKKGQYWNAIFSRDDIGKTVNAFKISRNPPFQFVTKGKVYQESEFLKQIKFNVDGRVLSYFRTDLIAELENRYQINPDGSILDIKTQKTYKRDSDLGFYKSDSDRLSPGFYTTVGLKNYKLLISDQRIKDSFFKILTWTLIWALATVILTFSLGLVLSLVLNAKRFKFKPLYRVLLIIPYSIPFFISVLIFKGMLNKDFGIINEIISSIGISKIDWLTDPLNAKISALLVNLWLGFPYMFLLITGILQSIPDSVYEAAKMDGAGPITTLRKITLPMVFSAIAPLLVGSFAFNLNNFVGIYLLTGGGPAMQNTITPAGETDILISYTYKLAFEGGQGQDFGMASSIALFIFIIITILTLINFRLSGMFKNSK